VTEKAPGAAERKREAEAKKAALIRYVLTGVAVLLAAAHMVWPAASIDSITLGLLAIAVVPWLGPLFKSIELPGGVKVEYRELQEAAEIADRAGLLTEVPRLARADFAFLAVSDRDPNLALAGLRIEIEKRLKELALATGGEPRVGGSGGLMHELRTRGVLSDEAFSALRGLTGLLNSAVHGAIVTPRAVAWAMEFGPKILAQLESRLSELTKSKSP
jgi:hypothetical protein